MAERRMFAKTIVDSDAFLEMPMSSRLLYYDLGMRADDDGFINAPKKIVRMIGASDDDLRVLISKKFIIPFDSGVVVIKHWRINNYLRSDRYRGTTYTSEKAVLQIEENSSYKLNATDSGIPHSDSGIPQTEKWCTQYRIGKDSIGKERIVEDISVPDGTKNKRFVPPTVDEIQAYVTEKSMNVDAEKFWNFYESKGWMVGKNPMKSWRAACSTWNLKDKPPSKALPHDPELDKYDLMYEEKP